MVFGGVAMLDGLSDCLLLFLEKSRQGLVDSSSVLRDGALDDGEEHFEGVWIIYVSLSIYTLHK